MKKYSFFIVMLTGVVVTSCKKQLDLQPLSQYSTATYWKTAEDATKFATQAYNFLPDQNFVSYEAFSDNAYSKRTNLNIFGNGTYTALNTGIDFNYAAIRHCLSFLSDIDKVPNMNQTLKNRLIGEVKFILAYRYFIMVTLYRDVPLIEKVYLTGAEANLPKTPKADIVTKIATWLTEAAEVLPITSATADNGRITKGAAYALLSRVYLYNEMNIEAASAAKKVMDLGVYSLYPNYYMFFQDAGDYSSEDILSFGYTGSVLGNGANSLRNTLGSIVQLGNNQINPTADLVDDYESDQGYYPATTDPRYNPNAPWDNRDPRLRQTIYYPGTIETVNPAFPTKAQFDPFNAVGDKIGTDQGTTTGFSWTKYVQRTDYSSGIYSGANNWKILRYAEVLLNFAEATNEVSGPTANVITAVDLIRARAKMPLVAASLALRGQAISQSTMRNFIRHERRIELACEGLRYFDILRWKIGEQTLNKPIYTVDAAAGITAIIPGSGKVNTYPKKIIETRIFTSKNYVWPLPQSAIDASNGVLIQADEWK